MTAHSLLVMGCLVDHFVSSFCGKQWGLYVALALPCAQAALRIDASHSNETTYCYLQCEQVLPCYPVDCCAVIFGPAVCAALYVANTVHLPDSRWSQQSALLQPHMVVHELL